MSVDGFVAGPGQDLDNPLGVGGLHLHDWVFPLAVWRERQGLEGGERLFDGLGIDKPRLRHVATVAAPGVTHLTFVRA